MFEWKCELCGFVADTPEARDDHKAHAKDVHTPEQYDEFGLKMHEQFKALIAEHLPADLLIDAISVRVALMRSATGSTRTTALACLIHGVLSGIITGLTRTEVVDLATKLYDTAAAIEVLREQGEQYLVQNAAAKAAAKMVTESGSTMVLAPASELKH